MSVHFEQLTAWSFEWCCDVCGDRDVAQTLSRAWQDAVAHEGKCGR